MSEDKGVQDADLDAINEDQPNNGTSNEECVRE
jgi:hypothetical protein